jgi:hypothetical protein
MTRFLRRRTGPSFTVPLDEDHLEYLVWRLNRSPKIDPTEALDEKTSKELSQLIADILTVERLAADKDSYNRSGLMVGGGELDGLLKKLMKQLNSVKWSPWILHPSTKRRTMYCWSSNSEGDWNDLAGEIFVLASYGMLDYIRRCVNCNKWFLASRRDQRFCCDICRVSHFKRTPEGRARNRAYMRTYRAQPSKREEGRRDKTIRKKGR